MKRTKKNDPSQETNRPEMLTDSEVALVECTLDVEGERSIGERTFADALGINSMYDTVLIRSELPNYTQHFVLTNLITETKPTLVVRQAVKLLSVRLEDDSLRHRKDVSRLLLCCKFSLPSSSAAMTSNVTLRSDTLKQAADLGIEIGICF